MAKIKGIELRNIVDFRGHEGESLTQADVYYKGKKVGYYSQDAWGGMDIFDLDYSLAEDVRHEIEDITRNYTGGVLFKKIDDLYNEKYNVNFNYKQVGYEYLFMDLLQLIEHENLYKKYTKQWHKDTLYINYYDLFKTSVSSFKIKDNNIKTFFEYNGLKDFDVK